MPQHNIISLRGIQPDCPYTFTQPIDIDLADGENWVVYGPNGSGKTFFINTLRSTYKLRQGSITYQFNNAESQRASDNISYVTFQDQYTGSVDTGANAYQMRWNQGVLDEEFEPRVKHSLRKLQQLPQQLRDRLIQQLGLTDMMERTIMSLSSGEFRRFQLAQILVKRPTVLIIDNPYIGLDTEGRQLVAQLLEQVTTQLQITLIIVVSRLPQSLSGYTHVIEVDDGIVSKHLASDYRDKWSQPRTALPPRPQPLPSASAETIMDARNITIRYGSRTILRDFNLTIQRGERWALKGQNGCGKSTLLSIICADNPQGYACDITLFGRRRGTGESIWDIKKHIGFVSPEMYRSYRRNVAVKNIIASGLYDTNGLFRQPKERDYQAIEPWMERFGISEWADKSYLQLSSGEQRVVLLCRAFVKNPDLLILDEPFHGLDENFRNRATHIINAYCADRTKTLIMVSHYEEDFPQAIDHTIQLQRIN